MLGVHAQSVEVLKGYMVRERLGILGSNKHFELHYMVYFSNFRP